MTLATQILADPAASDWLKRSLAAALKRDPVDAVHDTQALLRALQQHLDRVHREAQAIAQAHEARRPPHPDPLPSWYGSPPVAHIVGRAANGLVRYRCPHCGHTTGFGIPRPEYQCGHCLKFNQTEPH